MLKQALAKQVQTALRAEGGEVISPPIEGVSGTRTEDQIKSGGKRRSVRSRRCLRGSLYRSGRVPD
jgi:hypothetical protein